MFSLSLINLNNSGSGIRMSLVVVKDADCTEMGGFGQMIYYSVM